MSTPSQQHRALLAVGLTVFIWGWSSVLIKAVAVSGLVASFYRLWLSIPLLWLIPLLRRERRRGLDAAWLRGSLWGGTLFALHQALFFSSLKQTTVANVTLIGALQPTLVLLVAGRWFGEAAGARAVTWSLVALAGAALVILGAAGLPGWSPFGDALAFGNLFAFTAYFLASKRIRQGVDTTDYLIGMTTVAGGLMLAVCLVNGEALGSPQGSQWLVLMVLALLPGTLGHFLINWAHPHTSAFAVSMLLLASPVVACAAAALALGEHLGALQMVGAAVTLAGVAAVVLGQSPQRAEILAESAAETDAP
jgi:drug/metabolite transporter (DMT)-like permease